jgi:hypothetical protein
MSWNRSIILRGVTGFQFIVSGGSHGHGVAPVLTDS